MNYLRNSHLFFHHLIVSIKVVYSSASLFYSIYYLFINLFIYLLLVIRVRFYSFFHFLIFKFLDFLNKVSAISGLWYAFGFLFRIFGQLSPVFHNLCHWKSKYCSLWICSFYKTSFFTLTAKTEFLLILKDDRKSC